jgi:hypothetical protein
MLRHLLVPHGATSSAAAIWVGVFIDPPGELALEIGGSRVVVDGDWTEWLGRDHPVAWSQTVVVDGLEPGSRYPARLVDGVEVLATAELVTLPDVLPPLGATPFICLLGSCFAHMGDAAGAAGAAYSALPDGSRPDLKFLTGDQVYLDAPFPRYLYNVFAGDDLRAELLASYLATWTQGGDSSGFAELLRSGATYFTSDDHEIWNNAPLPTATVRATWWPFGDKGAAWLEHARVLYDGFQGTTSAQEFKVGRLSIRVLDTRMGRSRDRSEFMPAAELAGLADWVADLDGPGVLVIGQPIFVAPAGFKGNFTDFGLADFEQYEDFVRILMGSQHDLVVLTGDVHFGRVSGCTLPGGASLVEVIASPFALVDPRVGGRWQAPPPVFPAVAVPGVVQRPIWHESAHRLAVNQFATLEFSADGLHVLTSVRAWPIPPPGQPPTSQLVFQRRLN